MSMKDGAASGYCVFEYMYRDAGNWKTHGALLLAGDANDARTVQLRQCCDSGELFVAEQVGVPSLCREHFASCGEGPSDLEHAYHDFFGLRTATDEEVAILPLAGSLENLVERMQVAAKDWDVTLSPNCYL